MFEKEIIPGVQHFRTVDALAAVRMCDGQVKMGVFVPQIRKEPWDRNGLEESADSINYEMMERQFVLCGCPNLSVGEKESLFARLKNIRETSRNLGAQWAEYIEFAAQLPKFGLKDNHGKKPDSDLPKTDRCTQTERGLAQRLALIILAVYALVILLLTQGGCGVKEIADDLTPSITVNNVVPTGGTLPPQDCDGCPSLPKIAAIYSTAMPDATWGLGVVSDAGCVAFEGALIDVFFRTRNEDGVWARVPFYSQPLDSTPDICLGDMPVWYGLDHCPAGVWCGLDPDDVLVELWASWPNFTVLQKFAHPGDTGGLAL